MSAPSQKVVTFGPQEYPVGHERYGQTHPQLTFLSSPADITIYGGARGGGKTYALLLAALRHIQQNNYYALLFRREYGEIFQPNGMWDTSETIYPYAGGQASQGNASWSFPSGSSIKMNHMSNPNDWQKWLGSQIPFIGFDQLETFTEKQFWTMLACLRDPSGLINPYMCATCNPEPGWLSEFISWWWDQETGYPIMERSGVVRWFTRIGDAIKWGSSKEELISKYPDALTTSLTFIPAFVEDNPKLIEANPHYVGRLLSQGLVESERWHKGNWKVKATAGTIFNRAWFAGKIMNELPNDIFRWVRFWDMAATPVTGDDGNDPDWTAGALIGEKNGQYFIKNVRRFQKTPKENEDMIRITAQLDGIETAVCMEEEGGASGKSMTSHYQRNVLNGFNYHGVPSNKKKIIRWGPLSSALQAGNVYLLKGDWNSDFIDELDGCKGEDEKNDQADSASGAFNWLTTMGGDASVVDHRPQHERYEMQRYNRKAL